MSDDANGKTNAEDVATKLKRSRSNSGGRSPQRNGRTERSRSRSRDRRSKEKRRHRSPSRDKNRGEHRMAFISNIPYEMRWMELKDLIREKAGDVSFVEMIEKDGKPRGSAVVEFKNREGLMKCLDSVHRLEIGDRRLVVKEIRDPDAFFRRVREDTGMNFLTRGSSGGGGSRLMDTSSNLPVAPFGFETYGLSPTFLKQLGIEGQLCNRVFVANLPFNVSTGKIREVFSMAGHVTDVDLQLDMEGKSKGLCVVEYFHPIEAVQAISMLHHQKLYDRLLTVKMDRFEKSQDPRRPGELPVGLVNVGMGLGANGNPLTNVEQLVASGNFGPTSPFSLALSSDSAARRISGGLGRGGHSPPPPPMPRSMYDYGPPPSSRGGGGGGSLPVIETPSGRVYTNSGPAADFASPGSALALQDTAPYAVFRERERDRERDRLEREFSRLPSTPDRYGLQSAAGGGSSSFYDAPTRPLSPSPLASKSYGMTPTGAAGVNFGASAGGGASLGDSYVMRGSSDFDRFAGLGGRKPSSPPPQSSANTMAVGMGGGGSYASLGGRASRTIIIRNLPLDYSWQTLRDRMRGFGEVDFADVVQPGVGKIRFKSPSDAEKATVTLHGMHVEGRPISVDLANE